MARTVGVEEELLVVDHESGRPISVAGTVLGQAEADDEADGSLEAEFKQQQLETGTSPRTTLSELEDELRRRRDLAVVAARKVGARVAATGTSPVEVEPQLVREPRFQEMTDRFGLTATEQLTCGCHVHVGVESDDEGVAALNGVRVWLPSLLAISANSPFWQGQDSKYASYRAQAMVRWPTAGPTGLFESGEHYWSTVDDMVASGVILDKGMVYFDARLSANYPTVEIRVADVCLDVRDTVLMAALSRALVDTAVSDAADDVPAPDVPISMLRLAMWQASREGIDGNLLDPIRSRPRPAREVLDALVEHVRPALEANGDAEAVETRLGEVLDVGNGARQQRQVLEKTNRMADVVAHLARVTAGHD